MIKVLVVEDSAVVREFLLHILSSDPAIEVIGTSHNGADALDAVREKKPDVITMDIHMPKMNGFDATRRIMETHPTPIVVVSGSSTQEELSTTFKAMEAGALAVVRRPVGIGHPEHESTAEQLVKTVKLMSEVKVVKRWPRPRAAPLAPSTPKRGVGNTTAPVRVVAIGASTGGPVVLQTILAGLPKNFPVPIVIVQHMASGFLQGFVEWLTGTSGLPVHVAANGEPLIAGNVYVAPDGFHTGVNDTGRIELSKDAPESGLRPAVAHLFRSITRVYGKSALGVLLTGMGKDGAEELKMMRETGAITIAQDKESSVVHGMPGEAIRLDGATYVFSPDQITELLAALALNP